MKTLFLKIFLGLSVLALVFAVYRWRHSLTPLWSYQKDELQSKGPLMGIIDLDLLEDYFRYDHFGKTLSYQMKPHLKLSEFQNAQHEYQTLEAINTSLKQTLGVPEHDKEHLVNLLHKNLIEDFNRQLISKITEQQSESGEIDWKLQFIPSQKLNIDYKDELKKDGIIVWSPNSRLAQEIYTPEKNLEEKIKEISIPYTNQSFQYMAGEIHYKMNISPQQGRDYFDPHIKGEIHYTKFYRINTQSPFAASFESPGFKIDHVRYRNKDDTPLLKVTAIAQFNSLQLIPELRQLVIVFEEQDEFILSGSFSASEKEFAFETFISQLDFHVQNNSLDRVNLEGSVFRTDLLPRGEVFEQEGFYKHQISTKILMEHSRQLMQMFSNREFSSALSTSPRSVGAP